MFGKPRLTTKPVRCIDCAAEYPEKEIILKHAGRTEEGDYWNSKCPECGTFNSMQEEYAGLSDEKFRAKQHEIARQRWRSIKAQRRENDRYQRGP